MPGARRTDRISQRDLDVLEFVARFGVIPREAVALWAGTGRAVTAARERRLREAGLVEVLPGVGDSGRLVLCTRAGLRACGRVELPLPRFSPATVVHSAAAARVAAQLEAAGRRVLSEREIFARERAEGRRVFSAELPSGRFHRPDLILLGDLPEAIEIELTDKAARRLDEIMRAWRLTVAGRQFRGVRYLCSPRALPYVERAVSRTRCEICIEVEPLEERGGRLALLSRLVRAEPSLVQTEQDRDQRRSEVDPRSRNGLDPRPEPRPSQSDLAVRSAVSATPTSTPDTL